MLLQLAVPRVQGMHTRIGEKHTLRLVAFVGLAAFVCQPACHHSGIVCLMSQHCIGSWFKTQHLGTDQDYS